MKSSTLPEMTIQEEIELWNKKFNIKNDLNDQILEGMKLSSS